MYKGRKTKSDSRSGSETKFENTKKKIEEVSS